jgi:hypothetical protein
MLALAACSPEYSASTELKDGTTVTIVVEALFGLHSDWSRRLTVRTTEAEFSYDLPEDTGWWRGSALFQGADGSYLLHESDLTCLTFTTAPLVMLPPQQYCSGFWQDDGEWREDGEGLSAAELVTVGFTYLGSFEETPRSDVPIAFVPSGVNASAPEKPTP